MRACYKTATSPQKQRSRLLPYQVQEIHPIMPQDTPGLARDRMTFHFTSNREVINSHWLGTAT